MFKVNYKDTKITPFSVGKYSEEYSIPSQASKMASFVAIVNV